MSCQAAHGGAGGGGRAGAGNPLQSGPSELHPRVCGGLGGADSCEAGDSPGTGNGDRLCMEAKATAQDNVDKQHSIIEAKS